MNTFNVVEDTWNVFGDDTETMLIVYAVCHMVGMSSVGSTLFNNINLIDNDYFLNE
jgi:neuropeptide Y receptor